MTEAAAATVHPLVTRLEAARLSRQPMRLPTAAFPDLTLEQAYRIQRQWVAARTAAGSKRAGYKVAITTPATQRSLGTDEPAYGILLDEMRVAEGEVIPPDRFLKPRVEMELAFVMRETPQGDLGPAAVLAAVDYFAPAFEIVDCRVHMADAETGRTRGAIDIVADGGATAGFMLSRQRFDARQFDLASLGAALHHNGAVEDSGLFAIVMGAPERALAWLAARLEREGDPLLPGDIILCGSAIKGYPAAPGDRFIADFGALGSFELAFAAGAASP